MARRQRECYLCGETYEYCNSCYQDRFKPTWMSEFHSESCKNIFDICTRFNMGMMSKTEAQDALKSCDLSNRANFKSYVQTDLDNILKDEEKMPTKAKKSKSHEVVIKKENK